MIEMIIVQFSFDVPEDKIQEFLKHSKNTLKKLGKTWAVNLILLTEA
ncbi:MAG: hypothetical protein QXP45_03210 [Thermoproteota archaeon]